MVDITTIQQAVICNINQILQRIDYKHVLAKLLHWGSSNIIKIDVLAQCSMSFCILHFVSFYILYCIWKAFDVSDDKMTEIYVHYRPLLIEIFTCHAIGSNVI